MLIVSIHLLSGVTKCYLNIPNINMSYADINKVLLINIITLNYLSLCVFLLQVCL